MQVQITNGWIGFVNFIFILMTILISTGGVLPAPDGPPVRHVSHYGDAPSPAVCQVRNINEKEFFPEILSSLSLFHCFTFTFWTLSIISLSLSDQASSEYHETSLLPSSHHFSSSPFNNNCHVLSSSYYNYPVSSKSSYLRHLFVISWSYWSL